MSTTEVLPLPAELRAASALEAEYDRTVREDIELFRAQAASWTRGEITDDEFRAFRLRRGVYTQRQPGVHMIRTKVPGGQLTAAQMHQLADISDEFAGAKGHWTTRQNLQYHFIPLAQVPDLLHRLADTRLTTREACYNTVRNVTASPLAGLIEGEAFDVTPYAQKVAFAFLHKELTDHLPRKFKIAFDGGAEDTAATDIHDVGATAVLRDGQKGFRIVVGGGLGPLPCEPKVLDEFLPAGQIVPRIEAVIRLFNQHGNRGNKNKARLKFVLKERGWDWVRETIEANYADILANGGIATPAEVPESFGGYRSSPPPLNPGHELPVLNNGSDAEYKKWAATNVRAQKQAGYRIVTILVPQGNMSASQIHAVARLSEQVGDGLMRVTIEQNLVLAWVPEAKVRQVYSVLKQIDLAASDANLLADVVSCPGAYSCNLALTKTMNLGDALADVVRQYLAEHDDAQIRTMKIRSSGCPNACGQHWIGDFGFYGNARKVNGREIPYYQMLLGGGLDSTGVMRFGMAVQSVPARKVPEAMTRVLDHFRANREPGEGFRDYVTRFKVQTFREMTADLAKPPEIAPELYRDWGDETDFSLQLGRGECAS